MFSADNLPGLLFIIASVAAVLSLAVSFVLLWRYRRAVVRSMASSGQGQSLDPPIDSARDAAGDGGRRHPLQIEVVTADSSSAAVVKLSSGLASTSTLRVAVYGAAGVAFAMVFTIPWNFFLDGGFVPVRFLWLTAGYAWPVVMGLCLVVLNRRHDRLMCLGIYLLALVVLGAVALERNPGVTTGQLLQTWVLRNGIETLLSFCFLARPIRAVGPMVLAFVLAGTTGAAVSADFASKQISVLRVLVYLGDSLGLSAGVLLALVHAAGFVLFAFFGWWLLQWIGRRYRAKRISAQSLTMDALFVVFAALYAIDLLFESSFWALTGLVAFATYKFVTYVGLLWARRQRSSEPRPPALLLLRVFSLGRRSEKFFDALADQWLSEGTLSVIAGPDLVTSTVEPHEFLDYLGGRLSRQFVTGEADLSSRMDQLDKRRDPDGRFRVNEFFCYASTWRMTFRALARSSSGVLMDLRGFSRTNQGCLYEIGQLLAETPLERVLFMVDETTDRAFLDQVFRTLWVHVPEQSPNRAHAAPTARLFAAQPQPATSASRVLSMLFAT